jgi:hypothetical protein
MADPVALKELWDYQYHLCPTNDPFIDPFLTRAIGFVELRRCSCSPTWPLPTPRSRLFGGNGAGRPGRGSNRLRTNTPSRPLYAQLPKTLSALCQAFPPCWTGSQAARLDVNIADLGKAVAQDHRPPHSGRGPGHCFPTATFALSENPQKVRRSAHPPYPRRSRQSRSPKEYGGHAVGPRPRVTASNWLASKAPPVPLPPTNLNPIPIKEAVKKVAAYFMKKGHSGRPRIRGPRVRKTDHPMGHRRPSPLPSQRKSG